MKSRDALRNLMQRVRPYLKVYLESRGVATNKQGFYKCINPDHEDKTPSARLLPDETGLHCYGCGSTFDIMRCASILEGRPVSGPEFVIDNVQYLAKLFNVPFEKIELTEQDLFRLQTRNLYTQAKNLICNYKNGKLIDELYGWKLEHIAKWGIGTVDNWKDFLGRLAQATGYTKEFIQSSGIKETQFNEHVVTFAVHDAHSNVVGFSARDSRWLPGKTRYPKWVNSPSTPIYNKSSVLYGIEAARHHQQLYLFEGYGDIIEARLQGMLNCVALCGTQFTKGQLGLLKKLAKREIILALDTDSNNAGQKAITKIVDDHFSGQETIKVGIVEIPAMDGKASTDPREYIKEFGIKSFRDLEIKNVFKWRMDKISQDTPPEEICEIMMPLVLNEPRHAVRESHLKCLHIRTGIRLVALQREYDELYRESRLRRRERISTIITEMHDKIKTSDPKVTDKIVEESFVKIKSIEQEACHADLLSENETIDFIDTLKKESDAKPPGLLGWHTGFPFWDTKVLGMPKKECIVALGAMENIGKTSMVAQLAWNIVNHPKNEGLSVLVLTIDDSRAQFLPRFVALDTELPMNAITHPQGYNLTYEEKREINKSWAKIRGLVSRKRLDIKDTTHGTSVTFLEKWIQRVKNETKNNVLVFLDNFHKLVGRYGLDDKTVITHHIHELDRLTKWYATTIVCTMEMRKHDVRAPTSQDLFGSTHLTYDNNITIIMTQDLHVNPESDLIWTMRGRGLGEDDFPLPQNKLWFEKNKFSGWKGIKWLDFWPDRSKFFEVCHEH